MTECGHEFVSSCGGGMSGLCINCGHDLMVEEVERWLADNPPNGRKHKMTVHEYADSYEFRADDGGYTPTDAERAMIEDAIEGYLAEVGYVPPANIAGSQ